MASQVDVIIEEPLTTMILRVSLFFLTTSFNEVNSTALLCIAIAKGEVAALSSMKLFQTKL
jgi:hypothetical protein